MYIFKKIFYNLLLKEDMKIFLWLNAIELNQMQKKPLKIRGKRTAESLSFFELGQFKKIYKTFFTLKYYD